MFCLKRFISPPEDSTDIVIQIDGPIQYHLHSGWYFVAGAVRKDWAALTLPFSQNWENAARAKIGRGRG